MFRRNKLLLTLFVACSFCFGHRSSAQRNPVLSGDHPDPSIIRVGKTYWMTSTSGDWAPEFPLFKSKDLVHWKPEGNVFPRTPDWAEGDFWAPELVSDQGRVLVYYVARQRKGPLCVAVATANRAEGPYTDHGPVVCQQDGSIDPSFVRNENGQPFLIWKEDGNSQGKPTPIWAQPLTADLLHITGAPRQLLINDPDSWEGGVVEGPYILRHAGRFYIFYAGNACCGSKCRYAEGVARADRLDGPWEKDPANPVIVPNDRWKCPGHGTSVQTPKGRDYLLYHAYPTVGAAYLGRESILDEVTWNADGWPVINAGKGPGGESATPPVAAVTDKFRKPVLDAAWQWAVGQPTEFQAGRGRLTLNANGQGKPVSIERPLNSPSYMAEVGVNAEGDAAAGLGIAGLHGSRMVLARSGQDMELYRLEDAARTTLWQTHIAPTPVVWLRVSSTADAEPAFEVSLDHKHWTGAAPSESTPAAAPLGPSIRVFLSADGPASTHATFLRFSLSSGVGMQANSAK